MNEVVEINYDHWDLATLAEEANRAAETAERQEKAAAQNKLQAGKMLIAAKSKLKHGEWTQWLEENWSCSPQWARECMRAADDKPKVQNESDFRFENETPAIALPADTKPEKPIAQPKTTKPAGEAAGPKQAPAQPRTSPAVASPEVSTTAGWPESLRPIDDILNEIAQRLESIEPEPLVDWHRSEIRRLQTRDIQIPARLDVPDVHAAIERWCQWVNTGTDKTIPPNSPQLEAVWRMVGGWDVDTSSIVKQIDRCVGSQWSNLRPPEASNDQRKGYLI